jgi:hypothetical protein
MMKQEIRFLCTENARAAAEKRPQEKKNTAAPCPACDLTNMIKNQTKKHAGKE